MSLIKRRLNKDYFVILCNYFGNHCIYCDSVKKLRLHHTIPLNKGGTNTLGNIELVCFECHMDLHRQLNKIRIIKKKHIENLDRIAKQLHSDL